MFVPFSSQHFLTLAIGFAILVLIILAGRKRGHWHTWSTGILAFLCLSAYPYSIAALIAKGGTIPPDSYLPFQFCDIAAIIAGFAILTQKRLLCTLTYFWGLAGTLQALLTPAMHDGFPSWSFLAFFTQHFAIVGVALYLPIVDGWRPQRPLWKSPMKAYGWAVIYLIGSLILNALLHSNFGFSMHKPVNPSLLDKLGPWPWYLFSMQGIAIVIFLLLAVPFAGKRSASPDPTR